MSYISLLAANRNIEEMTPGYMDACTCSIGTIHYNYVTKFARRGLIHAPLQCHFCHHSIATKYSSLFGLYRADKMFPFLVCLLLLSIIMIIQVPIYSSGQKVSTSVLFNRVPFAFRWHSFSASTLVLAISVVERQPGPSIRTHSVTSIKRQLQT